MKNTFIFTIFIILFFSCERENPGIISFSSFPEEIHLKAYKPETEFDSLSFWKIEVIDSILIGYNFLHQDDGLQVFYFFNKKNFKFVNSCGSFGRGPGEIIVPGNISANKTEKSIYISDGGDMTISKFVLPEALSNPGYLPKKVLKMKSYATFGVRKRINLKNTFIQAGQDNESLLSIINSEGELVNQIGQQFIPMENRPEFAYNQLVDHDFVAHPDRQKFAVSYVFFDRIIGVDIEGNQLFSTLGPDNQAPDYEKKTGRYYFNPIQTVRTYWGMASDDKYIFARYLGKPLYIKSDNSEKKMQHSNILHVFDWNGQPRAKVILEKEIEHSFVIDGMRLIALDPNSHHQWLVYDLSKSGLY